MPIDPNAKGLEGEPTRRKWSSKDALLYALGVGAGVDELAFTTENTKDTPQRVLPTMAVILGGGGIPFGKIGTYNAALMLHGAQKIELFDEIPPEGEIESTGRIGDIWDKGKAASVELISESVNLATGKPLFRTTMTAFFRGEGGFGGERGPASSFELPSRKPDHEVRYQTRVDQPLIYRLSGDRNPLHSDPSFAKLGGFERPILHGLCTYGFTGRALLHTLCGSDPARFQSMGGRFSKPVMPGDELAVCMWVDGNECLFQTRNQDGDVVFDQAASPLPEDALQAGPRWGIEQAQRWWGAQPWVVGCNFIPSTAVNQLEMWQAESWDPETTRRELGFAAGLGFNTVRVYLHDLLWEHDAAGFCQRIEAFLEMAHGHGIRSILVVFDDVWRPDPKLGPQPAPVPGRHNSRWAQSPGLAALQGYPQDAALRERLQAYVHGVLTAFASDERVLVWDLYNEPGGYPSPRDEPVGTACLPLLRDVFAWARAADPSQPLTSGLWWTPLTPVDPAIHEVQLAGSDIVSFHHYGPLEDLERLVGEVRARTERPLLCTEFLARQIHSRFETHLPYFQAQAIGAISWGLVAGKTQTHYPWWSWFDEEPKPEPKVWFHDVLRQGGTPFDPAEVAFLRRLLVGAAATAP